MSKNPKDSVRHFFQTVWSIIEDERTSVTARKVLALEILYRTMNNNASSRLGFVPKIRLERLCVGKIFEKSDLASVKFLENLSLSTRISISVIENSFLYLLVEESLIHLLICVRYGQNKETS